MKKVVQKELLTIMAVIMFAIAANMIAINFVNWNYLDSVDKVLILFFSACCALISIISSVFHVYEKSGSKMLYEIKEESPLIEMIIKARSLFLASATFCLLMISSRVHFLTAPFSAAMAVLCLLIGICLLFIKAGR